MGRSGAYNEKLSSKAAACAELLWNSSRLSIGKTAGMHAAVEAGAAAAHTVGKVRAKHVIPRPREEVEDIRERPAVR